MNSAAMIPDLVFWIDCDPDKAMKRIQSGTLRMTSQKQEYFETAEIQKTIRQGFNDLLSGKIQVPAPFDKCQVIGPILNEGGLDELKRKLRAELRAFFNKKPAPLNVDPDEVDRYLLSSLLTDVKRQRRLPGAPQEKTSILEGWLAKRSPAQWMQEAEDNWPVESAKDNDVPSRPHAQSSWAILGTLSLIVGSSEIPRLHRALGPHRMVTPRHTQRLVKWLELERWIHRQQSHVPFVEAKMFKMRDERLGYGRLALAMWPLRSALASWRRANPDGEWEDALQEVLMADSEKTPPLAIRKAVSDVQARLEMITSGHKDCPPPESIEELIVWWRTPPPQ